MFKNVEDTNTLAELRQLRGYTQEQLARKTEQYDPANRGLTRTTISNIENGRTDPAYRTLMFLSKALDVDYEVITDRLPDDDE